MEIDGLIRFVTQDLPVILQTALMLIGGLKIISRYTPWSWDDALLSKIEAPIRFIAGIFRKQPVEEKKEPEGE